MEAKTMTRKQKDEARLWMALQKRHGYMLVQFPREADRYVFGINFKTGKGQTRYVAKIVVPVASALGSMLIAASKTANKAKTRLAAKSAARRARR